MKKQYQVTWLAYPRQDYPQLSGILSGLAGLEKQQIIDLRVVMTDRWTDQVQPILELEVQHLPSGRRRNIVIDFFDVESRIDKGSLKWCDIYFKRQFGLATRTAATEGQSAKVHPLGLTIATFSRSSWSTMFQAVLTAIGSTNRSTRRAALLRQIVVALKDIRQWAELPDVNSVCACETDVRIPNIVFQPRLWDTVPGCGDDFDVANRDRIETVRILRRRFPNFAASIGLVPSKFAFTHAPLEVLSPGVRTREYHKQLRQSDIAVNCVGLSGSVGWKFAEYLAAGNAVVSQPIKHHFLAPVLEGVNYFPYATSAECVAQCESLLANPAKIASIRAANLRYFKDWVRPTAHALKILNMSFALLVGICDLQKIMVSPMISEIVLLS